MPQYRLSEAESDVSAERLGMTGTVIMEVLCAAGVLFMIRFFVALLQEGKPKSPSHVGHLSTRQSGNRVLRLASESGKRSARSDTPRQTGFQLIVGGTKPPVRRVG